MNSLRITTKYQREGLYVYCNKCKRYSNISDGFLRKAPDCNHPPERQRFKLKIHIPMTKRSCRTLVLMTRNLQEAERKWGEFKELLEKNSFNLKHIDKEVKVVVDVYLLAYQMDRFIDFLTKGGFHKFESPKKVEEGTIKDYLRNFKYFLKSIARVVDIPSFRIDDVNDDHLDLFVDYIADRTNSNKTYNNIMGSMRAFYNHVIKYEKLKIDNPFARVKARQWKPNTLSFTKAEFEKVLSVTTEQNGRDLKTKRNWYKEWLPAAFKLGLYSCLRLEELVTLKYSDIVEVDGVKLIQANNDKVNKLKGNTSNDSLQVKGIPVIRQMQNVLSSDFDYQNKIGQEQFIIAPELARRTVDSYIGKGFTHFKRIAKIDENKCFKDLRTTFISEMQAKYNDFKLTTTVSDHSSPEVVKKHYLDQVVMAKRLKDFSLFGLSEE